MGNCLVTKLKEAVNNDNLPFYGELVFLLKGSGNKLFNKSAGYNIHTGQHDGKVWAVGDGVKMYSDQAMQHEVQYMTTQSVESGGEQVSKTFAVHVPENTTAYLHIKSKYNVENVYTNQFSIEPYPIKNLIYISEDCVSLDLFGGAVTGVLSDIAPRLNMEYMKFNNAGLQTYITGDIVDFAKKQVELGRTSGTCLISACNTLTYNGNACTSGQTFTITYNSSLPGGYSITV